MIIQSITGRYNKQVYREIFVGKNGLSIPTELTWYGLYNPISPCDITVSNFLREAKRV